MKNISLTSDQLARISFIEKEFDGLVSVAEIDWDKINKGDKVKAVQGAGIITHPSYYTMFDAKLLEGIVVRKSIKILKYGKGDVEVRSFSILWTFDKIKNKKVKIRTSSIIHDKNGLVANQIYLIK